MATNRKAKSVLATKYTNKPDDLSHKYYAPDRMYAELKAQGVPDDEIAIQIRAYIESEIEKCQNDATYFADAYGWIIGHGSIGLIPFSMEQYQKDFLKGIKENKYTICVKSRQLGCSTSIVFYALWFSIFTKGKRTLVVAHKRESAEEFITKLKTAYEYLPNWLKPSCVIYSKSEVQFDTKSRIKAITSNPNAARSFSATLFLLDEAAFIDRADEVVKGILPTVAASDGKLVAFSSPNGSSESQWFYRTYSFAEQGLNGWKFFNFPWTVSSIFKKNPNFRENQIRIDNGNVDKFRQEFECFPPDQEVLTPSGLVTINNISVGDMAISHAGRPRKITATNVRHYSGPLLSIRSYGSYEPIRCTPEHPLYVYDRVLHTYSWVKAKDITVKHLLVFPKHSFGSTIYHVISEAMCKLMAWYITEGTVSNGSIQLSLHNTESEVTHVSTILNDLGIKYSTRLLGTNSSCAQITICNSPLADFLNVHCGAGANNKRIPFQLIAGFENTLFDELMLGDGCLSTSSKETKYSYTTISKSLAYQVQLLANSLTRGYAAGITKRGTRPNTILGRTVTLSDSYVVQIHIPKSSSIPPRTQKLYRSKYGICAKVTKVTSEQYDGPVYNFSVQCDESYIVGGRAVHNCAFDVNLNSMFTKEALQAFKPSQNILNKTFSGITYEDTYYIWKLCEPNKQYKIGVDCASNKVTSRDYTSFQVINAETQEQVAEYIGKLPTEVFIDILLKTARHYNNAELIIEENSYSEIVFYLLAEKGYENIWRDENRGNRLGYNTNRVTRPLLIEKLLLFFNNPIGTAKLKSARLKMQFENFSTIRAYADGTKKLEAVKGNDDAIFALALALIPLRPAGFEHNRPTQDIGIAMHAKGMTDISQYSDEYLIHYSTKMGISRSMLESRLKLYHEIRNGKLDGTAREGMKVSHPVEEYEQDIAAQEFLGVEQHLPRNTMASIEDTVSLVQKRTFDIEDIFDTSVQNLFTYHRNIFND